MITAVVIDVLGTVIKGLVQGLEELEITGREKTTQTTALLRSPEYLEESFRLPETCYHLNSGERPSANTDMKNSRGVNNNANLKVIEI